jgi:hypothetical protein
MGGPPCGCPCNPEGNRATSASLATGDIRTRTPGDFGTARLSPAGGGESAMADLGVEF